MIGHFYFSGTAVKEDLNQAFDWYKRAADAGDADGQYLVSRSYYFGWGVDEDIDKAMEWSKKAVMQNNIEGKYILALCYSEMENYNTAFSLLTEAAEANYDEAQYLLGTLYKDGRWGRKNRNTAISWYKKAAEHGNSSAIEKLKELGVE